MCDHYTKNHFYNENMHKHNYRNHSHYYQEDAIHYDRTKYFIKILLHIQRQILMIMVVNSHSTTIFLHINGEDNALLIMMLWQH